MADTMRSMKAIGVNIIYHGNARTPEARKYFVDKLLLAWGQHPKLSLGAFLIKASLEHRPKALDMVLEESDETFINNLLEYEE